MRTVFLCITFNGIFPRLAPAYNPAGDLQQPGLVSVPVVIRDTGMAMPWEICSRRISR